eukprot:scaffold15880_cov113-Skeletonema_dohrnii-CCMP3373.AAC.4
MRVSNRKAEASCPLRHDLRIGNNCKTAYNKSGDLAQIALSSLSTPTTYRTPGPTDKQNPSNDVRCFECGVLWMLWHIKHHIESIQSLPI